MPRNRSLFLLAAVLVSVAPAHALAQETPSRFRFEAPAGGSILVHGEYPPVESSCVDPHQPVLHARYRGIIEVGRASDGSLFLIGELSFEDYLKGIAEVPRDWPMEALKAQVVAARTYALNRLRSGSGSGDYDLCATTECQVYVGMKVEAGPWGGRWVQAVEATSGQVLLYQGSPAITYYSSTSPGRTYDVEDVFGGEALAYLRGAEEPDDGASPLSRWRVEVPFDDLSRFLAAEGLWSGGRIDRVDAAGGTITLHGAGRTSLSKDDLRDALNESASCLSPDRYPTFEAGGYRLPQTVPSIWYRAEQGASTLVLRGRGWGHGVGMVQWGAYGKARRGLSYADILGAYYGGLQPQEVAVPGTIRVLVAEGLRSMAISPSGEATVEAGGRTPDPPWIVTGSRRLRIARGPEPAPVLEAQGFEAQRRGEAGGPLVASLAVSDEASVSLEFLSGDQVAASTAPRPFEEGEVRLTATVPDVPPGRYRVRAVVSDGVDRVTTEQQQVRVIEAVPSVETSPSPATGAGPTVAAEPRGGAGIPVGLIAGAALAAAVVLLLVLTAARRKGLHRP